MYSYNDFECLFVRYKLEGVCWYFNIDAFRAVFIALL